MPAKRSTAVRDGDKGRSPSSAIDLAETLGLAIARHQAGEHDAAESLYRRVIEAHPDNPDAIHYLGVLAHQKGDSAAAATMIRQAIGIDGRNPTFHSNLGVALQRLGQIDEAAEAYRAALALDPTQADASGNLGHLLNDLGESEEAIRRYEAAIRYQPQVRTVHKHLASLYLDYKRFEEAAELFGRYLETAPHDAEANSNYGFALESVERLDEAERHYRRAHEILPGSPEICSNLGNVLKRLERYDEAWHYLKKASGLAPNNVAILRNLALALLAAKQDEDAIAVFRRLIELEPETAAYHHDIGTCLGRSGRAEEAVSHFARAIELEPNDAAHVANLATAFQALNRFKDAVIHYKRAIELDPSATISLANLCMTLKQANRLDEASLYSHLLMMHESWGPRMYPSVAGGFRATCDFEALDMLGDLVAACETSVEAENLLGTFLDLRPLTEDLATDRRVTALHLKWGDAMMARAEASPLPPSSAKGQGRLRIGLLSSDLRSHAVAKFLKPLFDHYDRERFELHCYTPWHLPGDPVQAELRAKATEFRVVSGMSDRKAAALIRNDGVDVMFDLNGATQNSRIEILAWRPAPVQVSWLGYGATTGMSAIDYTLMDRYVQPTEAGLWVEAPLVMKGSWVCFSDYPDEPIADEPPLLRNGVVTFGTMNATYKYTAAGIALWAKVMNAVPGSRMAFVRPELRSVVAQANIAKEFAKHGIASDRLYFLANPVGQFRHLAFYNEMDVTLDTYPAVGGTTSCDAMWMGVPVVGRFGPNMHQRLNHALVNHCGFGAYSVATPEEYVETAVALAGDAGRLRELRRTMREAVKASPIYDAAGFVADFQDRMTEIAQRHGLR